MEFNTNTKLLRLLGFVCLMVLLTIKASWSTALGDVFSNMPGADWEAVRSAATAQAASQPYYKSNAVESVVYEGYFRANDNTAQLAVFSDDGADVYIDGTQVYSGKGTGQALPNLDQSLHQVGFTFDPDQVYKIKVDYGNLVLTGDTDIDGITLFCYGGGGQITHVVDSIDHDPAEQPEIMSGAINDEDHTIVLYAKIDEAKAGVTVHFEVVDDSPSTTPASLSVMQATTDAEGIAQTVLKSSNTGEENHNVIVKAYIQDDKSDLKETTVTLLLPDIEYQVDP